MQQDKTLYVTRRSPAGRHQNRREQSRRLRQIRRGTLRNSTVSPDTRLAAIGLVPAEGVIVRG